MSHQHNWIAIEWQYGRYLAESEEYQWGRTDGVPADVRRVSKLMCSVGDCNETKTIEEDN